MDTIYDLGNYRVDTQTRIVTRREEVIRLAPKTFDLLVTLIQSGGRTMSKQELLASLWPDTFVEEANLSFQISTLRKALGEEGAAWIETVPKHGYRFSGPVIHAPPPAESQADAARMQGPLLAAPRRWTAGRWYIGVIVAAGICIALYLTIGHAYRGRVGPGSSATMALPLTSYPGYQLHPSLSPDGSQVAFSWNGPNEDNFDIYVKLVGPGEPVRLTTDPAQDLYPAWAPDGRSIAFMRFSSSSRDGTVFIMPALGGAEKKLADIETPSIGGDRSRANLTWSPDGQYLAFGGRAPNDDRTGIFLISAQTGELRRLTRGVGVLGDSSPAFAPDGRSIAFVRSLNFHMADVYVQRLNARMDAAGEPFRATFSDSRIPSVVWAARDRLVYSVGYNTVSSNLQTVPVVSLGDARVRPEILPFGEGATSLSAAGNGRLVYARQFRSSGLWRVQLPVQAGSDPKRITASTLDDATPDYSGDGQKLAFASTRSGVEEIWTSRSDGSNPMQLTFLRRRHTANPRWSPDGQTIVFNSWESRSNVYSLNVRTGAVQRLTDDTSTAAEPRWSRDGKWIYYGCEHGGALQVFRIPSGGGPAVQITQHGGVNAYESIDRRWLYYAKNAYSPAEIWKIPIGGGEETKVLDGLSYSLNFAPVAEGIYFVSATPETKRGAIEFFDFATGRRRVLVTLNKEWYYGVALSPDHRQFLFSVLDHAGSNLMFADRIP
jgi:Tol biopolymer transport system component/DNA-binding winged helix-turn-helix (wHTH) protein